MKKLSLKWLTIALVGCLISLPAQAKHIVNVSISINKIYGINTVDQTYKIDGYLVASWQDNTIKLKPKTGQRIYENQSADKIISKDNVWFPAFEFINTVGKRQTANKRLIISSTGEVTYNERFQGTFSTEMDFRHFPFDEQNFKIIMEPFSYEKSQLVFGSAHIFLEKPDNKSLSEWKIEDKPKATVSQHVYHHLDDAENTFFSRLTISIKAQRKADYYLWQFILPLSIILAASWSVFWIRGFPERLNTSFTMMLTVVAYTFYTSNILPRLPYTTFIQRMIIMGYLSIFASILIIIFVKVREQNGHNAEQIMRYCRYLFPGFYLLSILIMAGVNNLL
ncbi:Cys-loop ligand-gated ion channel [Marinomonas spartinae]|uniref:gamma-aminobutyric-acid receptor subunit beta n=1 Tax=Marinomonas spartinae TaxID=1792290 RepID=UPI000809075D|nr:gamma-aminobutyric-acid receptor subunit beta [Marinomonas spartinae]SBS31076.1 Cys-loop ligand-gated ion channel [Marinomonas spartinae]